MMRFSRYGGSPNIGVFASVNENLAFVAADADPEFIRALESALGVETVSTTVAGSFVVGSLLAMNSNGAVVSGLSEPGEIATIASKIPCTPLNGPNSAAGNNILVNDKAALVSEVLTDAEVKLIQDVLGVECVRGSIAGCNTVGTVCSVTNKGGVCHADASDDEVAMLNDLFKVEFQRTSVNHGIRYVGAGILSNSKGALVGDETTPIEMGRIEEGLALY